MLASSIPIPRSVSHVNIEGKSRMRESRTYGSVRGAASNGRPYRDIFCQMAQLQNSRVELVFWLKLWDDQLANAKPRNFRKRERVNLPTLELDAQANSFAK